MKSCAWFSPCLACVLMVLGACSSSEAPMERAEVLQQTPADAGQERYCACGMDNCWNTTHLVVGLVPGQDNTADAGEDLGTVMFEVDNYKGSGGSCHQQPAPEAIGVACTATLGSVPSASRKVSVTVTAKDGRTGTKVVEEGLFNYCGWDIAYQVVEIPASGPFVFRATERITPCEMVEKAQQVMRQC